MGKILLKIMVILALVYGLPAHAAQGNPVVRGQQMRDFVRLTFEWPQPTLFTAKTSGNNIILTFDRKANPNMGAVLKQLRPYVVKAEKKGDGKTIILTLDKPHRVRTFISDNISGIDLLDLGGSNQQAQKTESKPQKQAAQKIPSKTIQKVAKKQPARDEIKPLLKTAARSKESGMALANLAPSAGEAAAPTEAVAVEEKIQPAEVQPPAAEAAPVSPSPSPESAKVAQAPAAAPEPAPQVAAEEPSPEIVSTTTLTTDEQKAVEALKAEAAATPKPEEVAPKLAPAAGETTAKDEPAPEPVTQSAQAASEENKAAVPAPQVKAEPKAEAAPVAQGTIAQQEAPTEKADGGAIAHAHGMGVSIVPLPSDRDAQDTPEEQNEVDSATASVEVGEEVPLTSNKIVVSADSDGATMRVPLKERTAMALFIRMNSLWVVFDKKLDFDLSDFDDLSQSIINKAVQIPHDKATVLRIPISDNIYPTVRQQDGQLDLAIILSTKKTPLDKAMDIGVSTEPPAPPHVFVPALEVGETIQVSDPDVGDDLLITPLYSREQGIAVSRDFVDFSLLASTQGVVVAKKADVTEVTMVRNGLRITTPKGANLSPQLSGDAMPAAKIAHPISVGTLFPDESWMLEKNKSEKIAMNALLNQTVFAPNEGAKNLARLRLAQLYLRQGFAVEAIGMLDNINRINPAYYRSAKLSAMRGVANFLMYRFNDAARDFGSAELNNNPEAVYWRDMLADLLGSPDKTNDFLGMNENYISKYPPIFRQRLAIVAADRAIAAKEYNVALKIFDTLAKDNIIEPIQPYVDYLTAKISAENGQEAEAMEVWKRLSADSSNKFVQARATFSAILWQLDNNLLTRDQAIDKFERLRLSWHGDGLELQVVQLLGELYFERQDYVNAMRVWQIGVTGFKNTAPAIEMASKMQDTFIKLFNEGIAEKMTPLEALALYYEYRNYTPTGATGTQMIEKLADRLVGVDLLSTAAQLLEQQMRTQMEKAERSRIGAKLAEVYLMNNQPKKAIKALQDSVYGDNPILQRLHRNQLAAQIMMQLQRPEEALAVLGQDESVNAEKLRAMIFWGQQNWTEMTNSIENMLKKRDDPSAPLTVEEAEFTLRLALAYVYQNDAQQLQYMRDYFGPLMKDNPLKQAFDFITSPDITLTTRNFDDLLESLSKTRGFINNYKARVEMAEVQ